MFTTKRALCAATLALALPIAACSSESGSSSSGDSTTIPMSSTEASSSAMTPSETMTTSDPASSEGAMPSEGAEAVEITASASDNIAAGDSIELNITGLNPAAGYYAAICAAEKAPGSPVPLCTGDRMDTTSQAWLKTDGGTTPIAEDGTATVTLTANPVGEGVDCATQECVIKVFGDHSEGFKDVADVPVTFAAAQ